MDTALIYGAYGYTGSLIVDEAVARGGSPVVAGRDGERLRDVATEHELESRVFDLERGRAIERALDGIDVVCNCAGPFVETAAPLVEACLETGTDYLDITGEFQVFDRLADEDERAIAAGVTVLPGVGFDVVPTDCLAVMLADRVPGATELTLAIASTSSVSRGTAKTMVESLGSGGVVRRRGRLVQVPTAYDVREIDFGERVGVTPAVTVPWGDVVTAAHSTGIETISVYAGVSKRAIRALRAGGSLESIAGTAPVKSTLERLIDATVDGPDGRELTQDRAVVWGEVTDGKTRLRGRLETPNPYSLTVETATSAIERTLDDDVPAGFQTPATAFGPEFILECSAVDRWIDEPMAVPS
ncbi:saccharopine dehydrogenase family protein [Natrialbaceae archaeon A-chndr2]